MPKSLNKRNYPNRSLESFVSKGANVQRLWASTSTKDPSYSDVMYVDELYTVNTLPPNTIEACADHCDVANRVETGGRSL